jgi:CubicO group peptidase (beta-lactamase class C family)
VTAKPSYDRVDRVIDKDLKEGTFPGGVLLIRDSRGIIKNDAYGLKAEMPSEEAMEPDTIFDLASLTKVVATTTLTLQLVESGTWKLTDSASRYLEEFNHPNITLKHLLTHTSGLIPWADLFSGTKDEEEVLDRLFTDRWPVLDPVIPPMERVIYSDLNFILLGLALERVTKTKLDDLARENIFRPLDMNDTGYSPAKDLERIAPTENSPTREKLIRGEVHDENCHALGGITGHAGLFSTARDLGNFVGALLNDGRFNNTRILGEASVGLFQRNLTEGTGDRRSLGWQLQSDNAESAGDLLSPEAFGHTGFTGGSIWIDPSRDLATVFLTNRVHPDRNRGKERIGDFRARLHDAVIGEM